MAFLNSTDEALAIVQIQRILRDLELFDNDFSAVPVSGVFESETRAAVAEFQAKYGLDVTGSVDYETWELMHAVHRRALSERRAPRRVRLFPDSENPYVIPNQQDDIIYIIQYMLNAISTKHDDLQEVGLTGIYDSKTEEAVRIFQRKNLLDDNGIIDTPTLEALFEEYESVILEKS